MLAHFVERGPNPSQEDQDKQKGATRAPFHLSGTPYRIRTGVTAVRGRRPEPLDEGSFRSLSTCPGSAGAAIIRTQFLFPSGVN